MDNNTGSLVAQSQTALTSTEFEKKHNDLIKFVKIQLKESKNIAGGESGDYGIIPYTKKKSLLKPGAEKLLKLFGLSAKNECIKEVESWSDKFVMYKYKCSIVHIASGAFIADATRSCNNKEKKHATKDVYDVANTIEAVAQKRALVAAVIQATMASEIFDADVSEHDDEAPDRSVTKEEDPRRIRIMNRLYGTASEHGWTYKRIHVAIEKKWNVDSITKLSNDQIEKLTEFIEEKYLPVGKDQKPVLREELNTSTQEETPVVDNPSDKETTSETIIDGEVTEDKSTDSYICKGAKHASEKEENKPRVPLGEFCSKECQDSYYPPVGKSKLDQALEDRKKNNVGSTGTTSEGSI